MNRPLILMGGQSHRGCRTRPSVGRSGCTHAHRDEIEHSAAQLVATSRRHRGEVKTLSRSWPHAVAVMCAAAAALAIGLTALPEKAQAVCSVLSHHPCTPGS